MPAWNGPRAKVQLKLALQRTKMLQEKMEAMQKQARKEISSLVEKGKVETARVKTEGLINTDIHIELVELMELYSEMLLARFALLEMTGSSPDPTVVEPLAAIIHAAPRTELRELHVLRELLMGRYGRDFAVDVMDNKDNIVGNRVISKLKVETPSKELVDAYIFEICKAYNVKFTSEYLPSEEVVAPEASPEGEGNDDAKAKAATESGGEKEAQSEKTADSKAEDQAVLSLEERFAALKRK